MEDTRPLTEIWASLSKDEQRNLTLKVIKYTYCTDTSWISWRLGRRTPMPVHQIIISKTLKHELGIIAKPETLFPQ